MKGSFRAIGELKIMFAVRGHGFGLSETLSSPNKTASMLGVSVPTIKIKR
jgi:hypothetical protein